MIGPMFLVASALRTESEAPDAGLVTELARLRARARLRVSRRSSAIPLSSEERAVFARLDQDDVPETVGRVEAAPHGRLRSRA